MTDAEVYLSVILPAYNEEPILRDNVRVVVEYLNTEFADQTWEIVLINDGSADQTPVIVDELAEMYANVRVVHHPRNMGLGQATKTGFEHARGAKIVIMDIDLSYSADHIRRLVDALNSGSADIVLASPYMKGGEIRNVPTFRRVMSVWANRFLSVVAHGKLSTLTCMVRAFDGEFARSLVLRSTGMEVMPETVYKSMILRGRLVEIPAVLDWGLQAKASGRTSSLRVLRQILGTLLSGFLFRPFMFFILPGLLLLAFSLWVNFWMVMHFLDSLGAAPMVGAADRISWAVADAYQNFPHTFIVGLLSLMLAVQLVSLGILALQSKSYFEEVFYLGSQIERHGRRR